MAAVLATATIPIVMVNVGDPVGSGLVARLARPGGNVTGSTTSERELAVKAVDWVHAAVPKATRVAVLMSNNPTHPSLLKDIQDAVKRTGLTVLPTLANSFEDFEEAFRSMATQKAGALTQYDERGWRATFHTTGMEHSPTSATGTGWERTLFEAAHSLSSR
jgi:ABC-type uncharacterized transport system substrate-binding protein